MTKKKPISQQLAEKTFKELGLDPKTGKLLSSPKPSYQSSKRSLKRGVGETRRVPFRVKALEKTRRQSPKGKAYQHSALYRNAVILRLLIKKFSDGLDPKKHHRLISQLNSSGRSIVANIREGYVRPTTAEYSTFLGYSHGSLEEIRGDIIDAKDDGLLLSRPDSSLKDIDISLKPPPNTTPKNHLDSLKRKIREIKREDLTYEIFIELINKTDYLLKKAVEGLDLKIITDEKNKLRDEIVSHWRKYW